MKILFLSNYLPWPQDAGTKIRSLNFLKYLGGMGKVTLVCPVAPLERSYLPDLHDLCERVIAIDSRDFGPNSKKARPTSTIERASEFLKMQPWSLIDFLSEDFRSLLRSLAKEEFDLIFIRYAQMAYYLLTDPLLAPWLPKTVMDVDDVDFLVRERMTVSMRTGYVKLRHWIDLRFLKRYYRSIAKVRAVFVTSEKDREYLVTHGYSKNVFVMPNTLDLEAFEPREGKEGSNHPELLFCGTLSYPHNEAAATFFVKEIFPLIRKEIPHVRLSIVGKNPTEKVLQLKQAAGVSVIGSPPSMAPYYRRAALSVVPLLNGAGTRIKILESMAYGVPVVSTAVGAEGLDVIDGVHLRMADAPESFAAACTGLLRDENQRSELARRASHLVRENYDVAGLYRKLDAFFETFEGVKGCLQSA